MGCGMSAKGITVVYLFNKYKFLKVTLSKCGYKLVTF